MDGTVDQILDILKSRKKAEQKCSLLIGAGCSVSAGIPTAGEFVDIIKDDYPSFYQMAQDKTYSGCMSVLPYGLQHDLIAKYVDEAKINWAHIAIAQLMLHGWVDRILTTNFDPLIIRACALVGIHPAVYDFAASQLLKLDRIPEQAVFHLHGQRTGFALMNTHDDLKQHSKRLGPLFKDAGSGRTWIVVGYSGENDPVFSHLADVERFDYGLYWVGYKDAAPAKHVSTELLGRNKGASFISNHDADSFFVELAQKLDCFPPKFVADPFGHLEFLLNDLTDYEIAQGDAKINVMDSSRQLIDQAKSLFASSADSDVSKPEIAAMPLFMAGHYDQVIALLGAVPDLSDQGTDSLVWSYINLGNALAGQAKTKSGDEADQLFEAAGGKYQQALDIKPDKHETLYNWGNALAGRAKTKSGDEADQLFEAASAMYQQSLDIKPDNYGAFFNWGIALARQAETKSGDEAGQLFEAASEKFEQALDIKPDFHDARSNWGNALLRQAKTKLGDEQVKLLDDAIKVLKPSDDFDTAITAYNLACAHALLGDAKTAKHYLLEWNQAGTLPDRKHLESDRDMDLVRNCAWFKEMITDL